MTLLLLALACAPETPAEAPRLADATPAQLDAAFASAFGYGSYAAYLSQFDAQADALAGADGEPCPDAELAGSLLTLTAAGCLGPASGITWSGRATAENAPGLADLFDEAAAGDAEAPYELAFEGWSGVSQAGTTAFEGSFGMSTWGLGASWESTQELRTELPGLPAFSTSATTSCQRLDDGSTVCTPLAPQIGWVDGLGELDVHAAGVGYTADGRFTGTLDLHGPSDSLHLDLDEMGAACVVGSLSGGGTVEVCLPAPLQGGGEPPAQGYDEGPLMGVFGPDLSGGRLSAGASTDTLVARVELSLDGAQLGLGEETHPLGPGAWDEGFGLYRYELSVPHGAYEPGVSTALPDLDDAGALALRLRAYDEGGAVLGCLFVLPTDEEGLVIGSEDEWFDNEGCPAPE